jgi:Mycotoxin biosynthesis protein UstYa
MTRSSIYDYMLTDFSIAHCLDILRQQLMCTVDTGLLGQVWWNPKEPTAFVDFNTQHTCKNYDAIRAWAEKRQLPPPELSPPDLLEGPGPGSRVYPEIP